MPIFPETVKEVVNQTISDFDSIRQVLIDQGVMLPPGLPTSQYALKLEEAFAGGGEEVSEEMVNFYDPYGNLATSWTLNQAQKATSLPEAPVLDRLVFQEWAFSLERVNALARTMNIGATYTTVSGASEFDLVITEVTGLSVTLRFYNVNSGNIISVDWGDGATENALTAAEGAQIFTHTYSEIGSYTAMVDSTGAYYPYGTAISPFNMFNTSPLYICVAARLGDRCSSIGAYAFYNCYSLTSITIPSSVISIGAYAFYICSSLTSVSIPASVTSIGANTFQNCHSLTSITIPEGVTSIGTYAFGYCYSLTGITIPEGVTSIGTTAFSYCYSLTRIAIPASVTSIGATAFSYCYSLTSITIPEGVTSIGVSAFSECYSLTSITIPEGVTSIIANAFQNCYSLTGITIPEGVTSIGANAFQNCYSLTSVSIPASVTSIGTYAFQSCYSLTGITIPEGVTSIGTYAFQYCYRLTSITIPEGVTSIGTYIFHTCLSLTSVSIPASVTSIGANAFFGCRSIKQYKIFRPTPPTLSNASAFNGINSICIIYIPIGSLQAYQTATNWTTLAKHMREMEE